MTATAHDAVGAPGSDGGDTGQVPVSVVVPVFNRALALEQALRSVAAQRRSPAELIVVDDGSTDGSASVAAAMGARVLRHELNRGQVAARNTGIRHASQPWIAFLDSDDEWLPGHLKELWTLREDAVFVASSSINCRSDPSRDRVVGPLTDGPVVLREPWRLVHPQNFVTMSTTMVRTDVVTELGGFRAHLGVVEDLDMWVRLLGRGPARISPRVTVVYHIHGAQITDDLPRTRSAHLSVVRAYSDRTWPRSLLARQRGAQAWDELRDALEDRRALRAARAALALGRSPAALRGALELLAWRARARRASARVRRDGQPTVALLLERSVREHVEAELIAREREDVRDLGRVRALLALLRRPAGLAVVDSTAAWLAARLLSMEALDLRRRFREPKVLP